MILLSGGAILKFEFPYGVAVSYSWSDCGVGDAIFGLECTTTNFVSGCFRIDLSYSNAILVFFWSGVTLYFTLLSLPRKVLIVEDDKFSCILVVVSSGLLGSLFTLFSQTIIFSCLDELC